MGRACCGVLVLGGVALALLLADKESRPASLPGPGARKEKPYPYPAAFRFGFDYRERSLQEAAWQARFHGFHAVAPTAGAGAVALTRYYPRYPDTEEGATQCWRERRQDSPFVYTDRRSRAGREPTAAEKELERAGWVAGYLESARRHPAPD